MPGGLSGLYKGTYGDKVARGEILRPSEFSTKTPMPQNDLERESEHDKVNENSGHEPARHRRGEASRSAVGGSPSGGPLDNGALKEVGSTREEERDSSLAGSLRMTENKDGALRAVGSARQYYYNTICNVADEELPKEYKVKHLSNVLDQGMINSCVAHGVAGALSANHLKHTGELIDLSVLLIYGLWRGDMTEPGMFMESTLENGREIGTSPREYAPENLEVPEAIKKAKEYAKEFPNAMAFKVGSFFKMRENANFVSDIKKALYQFDLPLVTVKNGSVRHCELIVGWDEDNFILQNSYGEDFGNGGFHKIPLSTKTLDDTYLVLADKVNLPFSDTEGHWAEKAIRNLYFAGIMAGYPDGTFRPDSTITRAELCKVVDEVMKAVDEKLKKLEERLGG